MCGIVLNEPIYDVHNALIILMEIIMHIRAIFGRISIIVRHADYQL